MEVCSICSKPLINYVDENVRFGEGEFVFVVSKELGFCPVYVVMIGYKCPSCGVFYEIIPKEPEKHGFFAKEFICPESRLKPVEC